jgi:hypothetical protein
VRLLHGRPFYVQSREEPLPLGDALDLHGHYIDRLLEPGKTVLL